MKFKDILFIGIGTAALIAILKLKKQGSSDIINKTEISPITVTPYLGYNYDPTSETPYPQATLDVLHQEKVESLKDPVNAIWAQLEAAGYRSGYNMLSEPYASIIRSGGFDPFKFG